MVMGCLLHITRVIKVAFQELGSDHKVTSKELDVVLASRKIQGWVRGRMEEAAGSLEGAGREVTCGMEGGEGEVAWGLEEVAWAVVWDVVWEVIWGVEEVRRRGQ